MAKCCAYCHIAVDGVAVEIAHHLSLGAERADAARRPLAGIFRKQVGLAAVIGLLFGRVGMVLVGGAGLRAIQPERFGGVGAIGLVGEIGIVGQQVRGDEIVDRGVSGAAVKAGSPGGLAALG